VTLTPVLQPTSQKLRCVFARRLSYVAERWLSSKLDGRKGSELVSPMGSSRPRVAIDRLAPKRTIGSATDMLSTFFNLEAST